MRANIDTSVLRKLEALLAKEASLRGSHEPHSLHEAEATAQAVQRLLLRHHLSMADAEHALASAVDPVAPELWRPEVHGLRSLSRRVYWQEELAGIVADAHLCALLVVPGSNALYFVGRTQDRAVASYAFGMLARFAAETSRDEADVHHRRLARTGRTGAAGYRSAWLRGFNLRIAERYRALEQQMVARALEQNAALARLPGGTGIESRSLAGRLTSYRDEATRWVTENVGDAEAAISEPLPTDLPALRAGYVAGGRAPLGATGALTGTPE